MDALAGAGWTPWAAVLGAALAYPVWRRLRRAIERAGKRHADLAFRQAEALQSLYLELGFTKSLPPTRRGAGSPDFLLELARAVLARRPRVIVESGSGVSTLVLARAAQLNGHGHVSSLEDDPVHSGRMRRLLEDHGLAEWATILDAPLREHRVGGHPYAWYAEEGLPPAGIDMLVVDGPPRRVGRLARYPAGPLLFPRLAETGVVFLDDANRRSERRVLQRWAAEFPHLRAEFRRCEKGCAVLARRISPDYS